MTIEKYLQQLLDLLLMENYEIEVLDQVDSIVLNISVPEEDSGILIGYHGETLAAIQKILRTVFSDLIADKRIIVNINDYRDQREEKIKNMIIKGIEKIYHSGGEYRLYRLNSSERFFAHKLISEDPDFAQFTSFSVDDDDGERVLTIAYKE